MKTHSKFPQNVCVDAAERSTRSDSKIQAKLTQQEPCCNANKLIAPVCSWEDCGVSMPVVCSTSFTSSQCKGTEFNGNLNQLMSFSKNCQVLPTVLHLNVKDSSIDFSNKSEVSTVDHENIMPTEAYGFTNIQAINWFKPDCQVVPDLQETSSGTANELINFREKAENELKETNRALDYHKTLDSYTLSGDTGHSCNQVDRTPFSQNKPKTNSQPHVLDSPLATVCCTRSLPLHRHLHEAVVDTERQADGGTCTDQQQLTRGGQASSLCALGKNATHKLKSEVKTCSHANGSMPPTVAIDRQASRFSTDNISTDLSPRLQQLQQQLLHRPSAIESEHRPKSQRTDKFSSSVDGHFSTSLLVPSIPVETEVTRTAALAISDNFTCNESRPQRFFASELRTRLVSNQKPNPLVTKNSAIRGCIWSTLRCIPRIGFSDCFINRAEENFNLPSSTRHWSESSKKKIHRAIAALTRETADDSDPSDAVLSLLQTSPGSLFNSSVNKNRSVKTRRIKLTQIYDAIIEEQEEEQQINSPSFNSTHLNDIMNMDAVRRRRSHSYVLSSDASTTQFPLHRSNPRLPEFASSDDRYRTSTLSNVPRAFTSSRIRQHDSDGGFSFIWSPPMEKSISAGLSPSHGRKVKPLSNRIQSRSSKEVVPRPPSVSGTGAILRSSRYSGGMIACNMDRLSLDEYASGDSGGSTGSHPQRIWDPKWVKSQAEDCKFNFSPRTENMLFRTDYPFFHSMNEYYRSSTLPLRRRGSWHVDRPLDDKLVDWNLPTSAKGSSPWAQGGRWHSFSPERLSNIPIDTAPDPRCEARYISDVALNRTSTASSYHRSRSFHSKHLKELTKSTEHLSTGFLDTYRGFETSFDTLRANLEAATSESRLIGARHSGEMLQRSEAALGSIDRLFGRDITTERLRRQCEREHRRLLKSLMSDSWEKSLPSIPLSVHASPGICLGVSSSAQLQVPVPLASTHFSQTTQKPEAYFTNATQSNGIVLPVRKATVLTAPRTTSNQIEPTILDSSNLGKYLHDPGFLNMLINRIDAGIVSTEGDQSTLTDQVTLAAVAGAAAATAMANAGILVNSEKLQAHASTCADDYTDSSLTGIDWNDPETLLAAYTALAEASGGEEAFLQQLSPELAATLVHHHRQLSDKLAEQQARTPKTSSVDHIAITRELRPHELNGGDEQTIYASDRAVKKDYQLTSLEKGTVSTGKPQPSNFVLEDVSRQPPEKEIYDNSDSQAEGDRKAQHMHNGTSRMVSSIKNAEATPTKITRRSYDFQTKRLLLMRNTKDRLSGGNGFGIKVTGGRKRSDGRLGAFVDQINPADSLNYLHGEISEGDEIIEWNGIILVDKDAVEAQSIINTPADEADLLVRSNPIPSEFSSLRRCPQELPMHTCSHRSPCATDSHRHTKLCSSHNPPPSHLHDSMHAPCCHQHPHTCQRPLPVHCEMHSGCVHKSSHHQMLGHVCRGGGNGSLLEWTDGGASRRTMNIVDETHRQPPQQQQRLSYHPNQQASLETPDPSPLNASNQNVASYVESETSGSPSRSATGTNLQRASNRQSAPANISSEQDFRREAADTISQNIGILTSDNPSLHSEPADVDDDYGEIELILTFDDYDQSLTVHVARARNLKPMDLNGLADPFVKLRLHPDPTEDMDLNRQVKYLPNTLEPEWQQTVVFMNCLKRTLKKRVLEVTMWDFDRLKMNDFMGQTIIHLSTRVLLDGQPHWFKLHGLRDIVIPGYRQPGTHSVAPPISQAEGLKTIKLVKENRNPPSKKVSN